MSGGLQAQSLLDLGDRQDLLLNGRILRRLSGEATFHVVQELPELQPRGSAPGRVDFAWDGNRAYQVGQTLDGKRVVSQGTLQPSASGESRWFWSEPASVPVATQDLDRLLGAWDESLIFLRVHPEPMAAGASRESAQREGRLVRYDVLTGRSTELLDHLPAEDARATGLIVRGQFYLFTAPGRLIRINLQQDPWGVAQVTEAFWREAGITLCRDTGALKNPFLFGRAFLDRDGRILLPAQVFLPLDQADMDRAWSKLPQSRRTELLNSGQWPLPKGKEVGWKSEPCFLRYDPVAATFTSVDREWFKDLVVEEDVNFISRRFRDFEPTRVYTVAETRNVPIEATLKDPLPPMPEARKGRGAASPKSEPPGTARKEAAKPPTP